MQRFFLTCAISLGLLAALQLYSQWVTPLTRAVEQPRRPPVSMPTTRQSSVSHLAAENWLPNEEWLKSASIRWKRSDQTFMYADTVEAADGPRRESGAGGAGDTIRMKPFAMIWKDAQRPDDPPLTIVAESARVRFENRFFDENQLQENSLSLSGGDQGRIVSAALEGRVRVTGPDGLVFEGQDFNFEDQAESAQLYSDHAVNFRYGPARQGQPVQVRGTSAVGLLVEFPHDPNSPLGDDMPRIASTPRSAELRGRVAIDFVSQDQGQPTKTRVTSEGPFQFDFATNTATFLEKVLVSRPRSSAHKDEIECNLLALIFGEIARPRPTSPPDILTIHAEENAPDSAEQTQTPQGLISRLELKHVRALAHQNPRSITRETVKLRSTENGLECELDDLQYDTARRVFTLTDPDRVDVWREVSGQLQKFEAPQIEIRHSAEQKLEQLSGVGAGQFQHRAVAGSEGPPDFWGRWKDRLDLVPNPEEKSTKLTIRGSATVGQLDQMQFSGQTLTAWMPPLDDLDMGVVRLGPQKRASSAKSLNPEQVPVRRIQGIGNVSFVAPGVVGLRIQQVDLEITAGQVIPVTRPGQRRKPAGEAEAEDPLEDGEPFVFECDHLTGSAVFDTSTRQADIREMHGFDGVKVSRSAPANSSASEPVELPFEQQPVHMTAREFSATNEGGTRQVLTLRGVVDDRGNIREPVIAKFGDISIEGPRVIIDREKNLATVEGRQCVLRFPVDHDFYGKPLTPPAIADIACVEKITFDGQRATFLQSVKASLLDNRVWAEQMTAILNNRIDFSADQPQTSGLAIKTLECQDKVSVEMYEYGPKNELVEILRARLNRFELDQTTGKFKGQGAGKIEDWRRTGTRRMLNQSRDTAQSNRPADTDRAYPWEYVAIDFKGRLEGNMQDRWGKLNEDVQLLYAPVKNANLIFKHDDLSGDEENVTNAVWVGSDQMTVSLTGDSETGHPPSASVEALGDARMEGHSFNAFAYTLRYEQDKEMFTLNGKGQDKATLHVQRSLHEPPSSLSSQVMRIFPSKQEVSVDGAKTFTSVFGSK